MDFSSRMNAVLHRAKPDMVPFAPYDNLMPRGAFARELCNRGMGLVYRRSTIWSEMPHVRVQTYNEDDVEVTAYTTPVGSVSTRRRTHLGRIDDSSSIPLDGLIKGPEDYAPVIYMIDDTVFHVDNGLYHNVMRDIGADGIIAHSGIGPIYEATRSYYGMVYGLEEWVYAQQDEPERFAQLLLALERRAERQFPLLLDCPAELIGMGSINGQYGPHQFQEYDLPFYRKYIPQLHARGKICAIHAHASNVAAFAELIARTEIDVVEAFTPPPIGNLSVADARAAWGPNTIIWVNFPETIFWHGAQATKDYTLDILASDPRPDRLVIGMTEMGMFGVTDDESERVFKEGIRAVMSAIEEFSAVTF